MTNIKTKSKVEEGKEKLCKQCHHPKSHHYQYPSGRIIYYWDTNKLGIKKWRCSCRHCEEDATWM